MSEEEIKKILIIRLSALGDVIHTLPAVHALRQKFQSARIDWVIEDKAKIFAANNPMINNIYVINRKEFGFKQFLSLISKIRKEKYDIALDFQQLFKSGIILGLSGAKRRLMLSGARELSWLAANEIVKTEHALPDKDYHVIYRNFDLVKALGCNTEDVKFIVPDFTMMYSSAVKHMLESLDEEKKTIILSPATTRENKYWTVKGWRSIIKEFQNTCNIIITAQASDKELTAKIKNGFEGANIIDLTGRTSVYDLVYIYKNADLVISPDSGSAQTAWASGAKAVISLFFATSAKRNAPFGGNYTALQAQTECSPCMKRKCRLKSDKNKCARELPVKDVISAAKDILKEQ